MSNRLLPGTGIARRKGLRATFAGLMAGILPLLAALFLVSIASPSASGATLTEVTNFGSNPTNLRMYEYVPNNVTTNAPVLVAVHYCTGSGPAFYSGTEFASLADRYGFIVIYPSATRDGSCFDVSSPQALTHNGGSDPVGIISMVSYVESHNNGDSSRVYVTGASSGAMMTNVLIGDYPDVFKAGAAFMGVPDTCFSASALMRAAASMVTLLTFLSSMPVALTKAGQSWKSPEPTSKATVWPSRSFGLVRLYSFSEKMPMGHLGQIPAMAVSERPRAAQFIITAKLRIPNSYWP